MKTPDSLEMTWAEKIMGIIMLVAVIGLCIYAGIIALQNSSEQIRIYCNQHPNSTITGDLTISCSDVILQKSLYPISKDVRNENG